MTTADLFLRSLPPGEARTLLKEWCWLVDPDEVRPVLVTVFGDWVLEDRRTGEVTFLDTAVGRVKPLAPSREAMREVLRDPGRRQFFLLEGQARRLAKAGLTLAEHQCWGWKVAPRLGGGVGTENMQALPLELHQRFQSRLTWALRDHPGTAVRPEVAEQVGELLGRDMTPDGPRPPLDVRRVVLRGAAVALVAAIAALQLM